MTSYPAAWTRPAWPIFPAGSLATSYRWLDLDGEGISGVLANRAVHGCTNHNLGEGRFGETETIAEHSKAGSSARTACPSDGCRRRRQPGSGGSVAASPGFYGRTFDAGWEGFRPFRSMPNLNWNDANLRFVDLTGDGIADVLITEDDALQVASLSAA